MSWMVFNTSMLKVHNCCIWGTFNIGFYSHGNIDQCTNIQHMKYGKQKYNHACLQMSLVHGLHLQCLYEHFETSLFGCMNFPRRDRNHYKISSFESWRWTTLLKVWKGVSISKQWQNFFFGSFLNEVAKQLRSHLNWEHSRFWYFRCENCNFYLNIIDQTN